MTEATFFIAAMPSSRPADYYLGYLDGCVFLDFDNIGTNKVCLTRISFDGHGCCTLGDEAIPLSEEDSKLFKDIVREDGIQDQVVLGNLVKKAIALNKALIWTDALEEYNLI